jgi:hypothetical protein
MSRSLSDQSEVTQAAATSARGMLSSASQKRILADQPNQRADSGWRSASQCLQGVLEATRCQHAAINRTHFVKRRNRRFEQLLRNSLLPITSTRARLFPGKASVNVCARFW